MTKRVTVKKIINFELKKVFDKKSGQISVQHTQ